MLVGVEQDREIICFRPIESCGYALGHGPDFARKPRAEAVPGQAPSDESAGLAAWHRASLIRRRMLRERAGLFGSLALPDLSDAP